MDDLILVTPSKESHINKLEDILSALLKNELQISPKKCQYSRPAYSIWGMKYLLKAKGYA